MTGGWNFVTAAYILTAVMLGGYAISLVRRLRREREATRLREKRLASERPGSGKGATPR